jgi:hypothetical protein
MERARAAAAEPVSIVLIVERVIMLEHLENG